MSHSMSLAGRHILLVESDCIDLMLAKVELEAGGAIVTAVPTAFAAERSLGTPYDLALIGTRLDAEELGPLLAYLTLARVPYLLSPERAASEAVLGFLEATTKTPQDDHGRAAITVEA